jgi:hypothetical protein
LKYREENVNGIKDDKEKIKENMKKLKERLIQRTFSTVLNMMFLALNQQRGDFWPSFASCGILRIQSIILPRIPCTNSQSQYHVC